MSANDRLVHLLETPERKLPTDPKVCWQPRKFWCAFEVASVGALAACTHGNRGFALVDAQGFLQVKYDGVQNTWIEEFVA